LLTTRSLGVALSALLILAPGCSRDVTTASTPDASPTPVDAEVTPSAAPAAWQVIATSVQGRPLRTLTIGQGARKVLFIGGIHGDEDEGAYSASQLPAAFLDAGLADSVTLMILEDANPDGRALRKRENANGVDLNRNFPATNFDSASPSSGGEPLNQPESRAVTEAIERFVPDLVIVLHSWAGREFINFDGPARPIAERFAAASGMTLTESTEFATTPGSLGSYVGRDRGIPLLTVEFRKGSDPQADWNRIRAALIDAIRGG